MLSNLTLRFVFTQQKTNERVWIPSTAVRRTSQTTNIPHNSMIICPSMKATSDNHTHQRPVYSKQYQRFYGQRPAKFVRTCVKIIRVSDFYGKINHPQSSFGRHQPSYPGSSHSTLQEVQRSSCAHALFFVLVFLSSFYCAQNVPIARQITLIKFA